jgi:hypothetical protein
MAKNRLVTPPPPPPPKKENRFFLWMNRYTRFDRFFVETTRLDDARVPVRYFYYLTWVVGLLVMYVAIGFFSERTVRKSLRLKAEIEDLRAEYTSIKADYMKKGKQSEVAPKVRALGIEENLSPPQKIVVDPATLTSVRN